MQRQPTHFKHQMILMALAAAIIFMASQLPKFFREVESAHWPSVAGVILQTNLAVMYVHNMPGYVPELHYRYEAAGELRMGTRIDFHTQDGVTPRKVAESRLRTYAPGKSVRVYYDPESPQEAVLEPGIKPEQRKLLYAGLGYIALMSAAFLCVLYDLQRSRARAEQARSRVMMKPMK